MDTSRNSYQRLWCGSLYDTGDKSEIGEIIHFVGTQRTASNLAQYKKYYISQLNRLCIN